MNALRQCFFMGFRWMSEHSWLMPTLGWWVKMVWVALSPFIIHHWSCFLVGKLTCFGTHSSCPNVGGQGSFIHTNLLRSLILPLLPSSFTGLWFWQATFDTVYSGMCTHNHKVGGMLNAFPRIYISLSQWHWYLLWHQGCKSMCRRRELTRKS